jgi:hypothetical protein
MNIPEFNAEASLYRSKESYITGVSSNGGNDLIHPALAPNGVRAPNGARECGACLAICWLICEGVGESNCLTRCWKICCEKEPIIART